MPHVRQNSYTTSLIITLSSDNTPIVQDKSSSDQQTACAMKRINSCGILESASAAAWIEEVSECSPPCLSNPAPKQTPPLHKALIIRSADVYASQGNYTQAVKLYTQAITMSQEEGQNNIARTLVGDTAGVHASGLYYSRALCYYNMSKWNKALCDLDCSIARNPSNPQLYKMRGDVFLLLNRQQLAALDYIRASELETANILQQEEQNRRQQLRAAATGADVKTLYWNIASVAAFCITCTTSMVVLWCF